MIISPLGLEIPDHRVEVVGYYLAAGFFDQCRNRDAARVVRETLEIGVLQARNVQHGIDFAGVEVKGPGTFVVGWSR